MKEGMDPELYTSTTQDIRVTVLPEHLPQNSDLDRSVYAFAYTITIHNMGDSVVQLLERHWIIRSEDVQIGEVLGPGVVGVQPIIQPKGTFQYTSGAVINDPIGSMEGSYTFRTLEGRVFQVTIPTFRLRYPITVH